MTARNAPGGYHCLLRPSFLSDSGEDAAVLQNGLKLVLYIEDIAVPHNQASPDLDLRNS